MKFILKVISHIFKTIRSQWLINIIKSLGIYSLLQKIYYFPSRMQNKIQIRQECIRRFGKEFKITRIGSLTVQNITFPFYDPEGCYIPQNINGREYEPKVTSHLEQLLKNDPVSFIDIGAHYGFFTSYVNSLNKKIPIYSFEPSKIFYPILEKNKNLLQSESIKTCKIALSDKEEEIFFENRSFQKTKKSYMVKGIPFDIFKTMENIVADIVKIDVHGGEGKVLFGMKDALKNEIKHLYLEIHPQEMIMDYTIEEIIDLILESGFTIYEIDEFRINENSDFKPLADPDVFKQKNWTSRQIADRRMVYCTKKTL
ncbi:MAG: FkbM family methyltransferase [Prolixibacteraceae bacterium]|nr:FkbM family methyltransferase [Prolixibacteraceae bacterium]